MNNYRIRLDENSKILKIPITVGWDLAGVNDSIDIFQEEVLRQTVNPIDNFESTRYSHKPWNNSINELDKTSITYEFYFYSASSDASITAQTTNVNWVTDYRANGISTYDVLFMKEVFTKSFFKLDFYDTKSTTNQQIYLTVIIPTHQGKTMSIPFGVSTVDIKKPVFELDFVGDKEGYFIYWLKDTEFVDLTTLYMSGKFYDSSTGQFKRLMTIPQGTMGEKFKFNTEDYFYYTLNLDYNNYTYEITLTNPLVQNQRVGTIDNPIKWYEYVNPPPPVKTTTGGPSPTPTVTPSPSYFQVSRCSDGKLVYAIDDGNLGIGVGDNVKILGASNSGCWEVIGTANVTSGVSIVSKHVDCSCS